MFSLIKDQLAQRESKRVQSLRGKIADSKVYEKALHRVIEQQRSELALAKGITIYTRWKKFSDSEPEVNQLCVVVDSARFYRIAYRQSDDRYNFTESPDKATVHRLTHYVELTPPDNVV